MFITVGVGLFRLANGSLGMVANPPEMMIEQLGVAVTPFLLLHAFSSGTAALTGIEAISNGITAFKEPRSKNAGITLIWMASILGTLFLGISLIAGKIHAMPSEHETVISQIARTIYGGQGFAYLAVIAGTAVILIMAANTAFADFPRLGALQANDGFLPRQLTFRGSRLVYSRGIVVLAGLASLLIILFQASVTRLIPLYAIGVFLSFTLSQSGMARRWWKSGHLKPGVEINEPGSILKFDKSWKFKMVVNGFGAVCTFIVMIVFAVTKFKDGAWVIVFLIPSLIAIFMAIHHHYKNLANSLSLRQLPILSTYPTPSRHRPARRGAPRLAQSPHLCSLAVRRCHRRARIHRPDRDPIRSATNGPRLAKECAWSSSSHPTACSSSRSWNTSKISVQPPRHKK